MVVSLIPNFNVTVLCSGYPVKSRQDSPPARASCLLEWKVPKLAEDFATACLLFENWISNGQNGIVTSQSHVTRGQQLSRGLPVILELSHTVVFFFFQLGGEMTLAATLVLWIQVTLRLRKACHKGGDREAPKGS